jgi:hypothetical protein
MAISSLGSATGEQGSYANPFDWNITIPANTTAIVLAIAGWTYTLNTATMNGGTESFVLDRATTSAGSNDDVTILHLFTTTTGAQTIRLTYAAPHGNDSRLFIAYYGGTSTVIGDVDSADGYSLTLTTTAGDMVVGVASSDGAIGTSGTWPELQGGDASGVSDTSLAELSASGSTTTLTTTNSATGIAAVVLQQASGGGRASKNTVPWPLGMNLGAGIGMAGSLS